MTITEYMTELNTRAEWVGPLKAKTADLDPALTNNGELGLYEVLMLVQLKNGTYQGVIQPFYVLDQGGAGETIYPVNQDRKSETPATLRDQLRTYLDTQITATRIRITIDQLNEDEMFAICTAYEVVAGEVTAQRYFVQKDEGQAPVITPYVG